MLKIIWLGMLLSGLILLLLTIVLSMIWKIFNIINELNGKNAKKQIERLKNFRVSNTTGTLVVDTEDGDLEELPIKDFKLDLQNVQKNNVVVDDYEDKTGFMNDSTSFMEEMEVSTSNLEETSKELKVVKVIYEISSLQLEN